MSSARYIVGDTRKVLATLPDDSVDLVLTSPPFLALRSYLPSDHPDKALEMGSEAAPGEFIDALLDVVEELDRVLAPHGSIAIELGDTYSGSGGAGGDYNDEGLREGQPRFKARQSSQVEGNGIRFTVDGKGGDGWPLAKSQCLIPELFRFSLAYGFNPLTGRQTDRWRVRNVVRWCRPNPPVGALGDKFRPATSEMVIACKSAKRYFDLDAVRTDAKYDDDRAVTMTKRKEVVGENGFGHMQRVISSNPAGAPPLDWWEIPTQPYVTPNGLLVVPSGETSHRVRVPVGVDGDDIRRTMSPSCPVHASPGRPGSNGEYGEREDNGPNHNEHIDDRLVPMPADGSLPKSSTLDQPVSVSDLGGLFATAHNSPAHKTGPAPATSLAGTPSAGTLRRTVDTPTEPALFERHHDTPENSISLADSDAHQLGNPGHNAGSSLSSSCSCSYWVEIDVAPELSRDYAGYPSDWWNIPTQPVKLSHYATFPEALCVKPIKAMCPEKVCVTCGEPSVRIVDTSHLAGETNEHRGRGLGSPAKGGLMARVNATTVETLGWTDCGHNNYRRGVVLDCFAGSGTTLCVATGHGRDAIGIDLDESNAELAAQRVGMFLNVEEIKT